MLQGTPPQRQAGCPWQAAGSAFAFIDHSDALPLCEVERQPTLAQLQHLASRPDKTVLPGMAAAQQDVSGAFQVLQAACQGQLPLTTLAQQLEQ